MQAPPTIVWFRQDLRVEDNPAFSAACELGAVIPIYILAPQEEGEWSPGAASNWWLHHSLKNLQNSLSKLGSTLLIRSGDSLEVLLALLSETGAKRVFWNRRFEPSSLRRDSEVKKTLHESGIEVKSFNANLLFDPWTIANKQGKPFQVFTPFWKSCLSGLSILPPLPNPNVEISLKFPKLKSTSLDALKLLPTIKWDVEFKKMWKPGACGAKLALDAFLKQAILHYEKDRDRPDKDGVSRLSPHLHFGEISPRVIWAAVTKTFSSDEKGVECYLKQLGWREFAHHLLYHFPFTPNKPLRSDFSLFPWKEDLKGLAAWQQGMTGYPLVDAGMRELSKTGWMHNRVRMVVGSFLVKDLRINWIEGARWFWNTLVDADLANNTLGWQWVGGCGADAAPYFRIFNPTTQAEKFDPEGLYVRKWVPELSSLSNKWIHRPWEAPPSVLHQAGVILGKTYPYPIVDHAKARAEALESFFVFRKKRVITSLS